QAEAAGRNALGFQLADNTERIAEDRVHRTMKTAFHLSDERTFLISVKASPAHDLDRHPRQLRQRRSDQIGFRQHEMNNRRPAAQHRKTEVKASERESGNPPDSGAAGGWTIQRRQDDGDAAALKLGLHRAASRQTIDADPPPQLNQGRRDRRELAFCPADQEIAANEQDVARASRYSASHNAISSVTRRTF